MGPRCRCWHALCAGTSPENAFLRNTGWKGQSETNYFSPPTQPRLVVRTLAHTVSSHLSVCAVSDHGYVDYSTQKTNESSTRTAIDVALDDTGGVGQFLRILNERHKLINPLLSYLRISGRGTCVFLVFGILRLFSQVGSITCQHRTVSIAVSSQLGSSK